MICRTNMCECFCHTQGITGGNSDHACVSPQTGNQLYVKLTDRVNDVEDERDRLKAELEATENGRERYAKEIDRLKAELEAEKSHFNELVFDRDRYRALAEKMREALEAIAKAESCVECNESSTPIPPRHSCNIKIAIKTLALFDANPINSCKGKPGQVFCEDKNCGNRDTDGLHWAAGHPMNKESRNIDAKGDVNV